MNTTRANLATDFPGMEAACVWSSTTDVQHTDNAWSVYFVDGGLASGNWWGSLKVWAMVVHCVRGGI